MGIYKSSILSIAIAFVALIISFFFKVDVKSEIIIDIPIGSSANTISEQLKNNKLIFSKSIFILLTKVTQADQDFKAGEYRIESPQSVYNLVNKIRKGDFFYRKLTLLPGSTFSDILKLGNLENLVNDLDLNPEETLKSIGINIEEGIFYPDTFYYQKGETFSSVLLRSHNKWKKISNDSWEKRDLKLPYKNLREAITLASIIEKEGLEKKKIAGVFINRLRKNMRLQSDPTVIYSLGKNFDGNLTRKDLQIDNPYNTYRYRGLPPGPISIVSFESLEAALNPLRTDYLYFVSMGNGFHKFSKTLAEHNEAVLKYQINAR